MPDVFATMEVLTWSSADELRRRLRVSTPLTMPDSTADSVTNVVFVTLTMGDAVRFVNALATAVVSFTMASHVVSCDSAVPDVDKNRSNTGSSLVICTTRSTMLEMSCSTFTNGLLRSHDGWREIAGVTTPPHRHRRAVADADREEDSVLTSQSQTVLRPQPRTRR